jgi:hypothetical protein
VGRKQRAINPHIVKRPAGIARRSCATIHQGLSIIREIVVESGGTMVAVTDNEIREAQAFVLEDEGIGFARRRNYRGGDRQTGQERCALADQRIWLT